MTIMFPEEACAEAVHVHGLHIIAEAIIQKNVNERHLL